MERGAFNDLFKATGIRDSTDHMSDEDIRNTAIVEINKRTHQAESIESLQGKNNRELYDRLRQVTGHHA